MTRAVTRLVAVVAGLLLATSACGSGEDDTAPSTTSTGPTTTAALEDILLTAEDVPEPFGPSGPSDDPTWILQPLCDGRPDVAIPAPVEIVDARFEGPDDDIWLSSTVARFDDGGAQSTIDAYRSEADRCAADRDIELDALSGTADDALLVTTVHGEGEEVRRWVSRVGDLVVEVSLSWLFADPAVVDQLVEQSPALFDAVVARVSEAR